MDQFKVQAALSGMMNAGGGSAPGAPVAAASSSPLQSMPEQAGTTQAPQSNAKPPAVPAKEPASLEAILAQAQNGSLDKGGNQHHPVAEFLYQLTKMLTDDNKENIEWVDGRIKVHHPDRLESEVLHKYFRHSKFASFQRQLNYFGFRKIAGKGKMSPCSYVNEAATSDIRSLLLIKRKTNGSAARKAMAQRHLSLQGSLNPALGTGLPGLTGASAGLGFGGFGALNQFQMQKQLSAGLLADNPLSQFLAQNQQQQSWNDLQQLGGLKPHMPSVEQLQAQLASLTKQQSHGVPSAAWNVAALNMASNGGSMNLSQIQTENPATAALNASSTPATAASQAANAAADQSNNLFESATNLKALIGNDQISNDAHQAKAGANGGLIPNGGMLNRLPSSNGMLPGLTSNASIGNLLASSNRLNSLLSLNSFLSREPSLADLAMMPNGAQLAALQQQQNQQDLANRLNQQSN